MSLYPSCTSFLGTFLNVFSFSVKKLSQTYGYNSRIKKKKKETRAEGEEKKIQPLIFCTTIDGEVNIIQPTEMPRLRLRRSCLWC